MQISNNILMVVIFQIQYCYFFYHHYHHSCQPKKTKRDFQVTQKFREN